MRLIRLSDLQEIPEAHVLKSSRLSASKPYLRTKHLKLVLVITNHLRCIDGTNPNLAERLCRTISTEVEDPYSRVHESQFSKPVC